MADVGWLFVYTPFPWLGAMYIAAYRHDLSRLARPFRDSNSSATWWSVCRYLTLVGSDVPAPARRVWRSKSCLGLIMTVTISLLPLVIFVSLAWYYLALLQVTSAFLLFLILVNRIGPFPIKKFADSLPYPRLGTRIRHLSKSKGEKFSQIDASADSKASLNKGDQAP